MSKKSAQHTARAASHSAVVASEVGLERLVFFSDAVFAIAITLLALDIRLPDLDGVVSDTQLLDMLRSLGSRYLGFVVSFLVIGLFWMGHHRRYSFIRAYDSRLVFLNLLVLMGIAFVPFPTAVISKFPNVPATILYALTIAAIGALTALGWIYVMRHPAFIDPDFTPQQQRKALRRILVMPAVFLLSIPVTFINADLAKFFWLLILPALWFFG